MVISWGTRNFDLSNLGKYDSLGYLVTMTCENKKKACDSIIDFFRRCVKWFFLLGNHRANDAKVILTTDSSCKVRLPDKIMCLCRLIVRKNELYQLLENNTQL